MCTIASTTAAIRLQAQLLLRQLLATTIAISISGITRRANRYSTQSAAVYLHVADRYSTSTSGITRRANRYSTQIAAVLACSRPLYATSTSGITRRANRYSTQITAVLVCLFACRRKRNDRTRRGPMQRGATMPLPSRWPSTRGCSNTCGQPHWTACIFSIAASKHKRSVSRCRVDDWPSYSMVFGLE